MVDVLTPEQRSACMRAVRGKNTTPEMAVRKLAHSLGYRYRLNAQDLPGKPDLVFVSRRKIIFVHGCFWHKHGCPRGKRTPGTNTDYWTNKRERNVLRDRKNIRALRQDGWKILVIWECWTRKTEPLLNKLKVFLEDTT